MGRGSLRRNKRPAWTRGLIALIVVSLLCPTGLSSATDRSKVTPLGDSSTATPVWTNLSLPSPLRNPDFCNFPTGFESEMVYDASDDYPLLIASYLSNDGACDEQFGLVGGMWTPVGEGPSDPTLQGPPAPVPKGTMGYCGTTYDSAAKEVLAYGCSCCPSWEGGECFNAPFENTTWAFHGGMWTNITFGPSDLPSNLNDGYPASFHLAYDSTLSEVLLLLNFQHYNYTTTWAFRSGAWTNVTTAQQPPPLPFLLAADSTTGGVLWLGGGCTWMYTNSGWTNLTSTMTPGPLFADPDFSWDGPALSDDPAIGGDLLMDTWTFNGEEWENVTAPGGPFARAGESMAYDPSLGGVLLWGGFADGDTYDHYGDTWLYGPPQPVNQSPAAGGLPAWLLVAIVSLVIVVVAAVVVVVLLKVRGKKREKATPTPEPAKPADAAGEPKASAPPAEPKG